MQIIKSTPNDSGAYPPIQSWTEETPPDGYYQVADICDTSAMQTHAGLVTLIIEDGVITAITGDDAAYQAYLASLPTPAAPEPDATTQTQLALAELAETEAAHDIENKLALAELAEMIGGTANG